MLLSSRKGSRKGLSTANSSWKKLGKFTVQELNEGERSLQPSSLGSALINFTTVCHLALVTLSCNFFLVRRLPLVLLVLSRSNIRQARTKVLDLIIPYRPRLKNLFVQLTKTDLAMGLAMASLVSSSLARDVPVIWQNEVLVARWEGRAFGGIYRVGGVEDILGGDGWLEAEKRL